MFDDWQCYMFVVMAVGGNEGAVLCQVNGQSLLGCSHQDAVNALRSIGSDLIISVCDGFDPSVLSSLEPGSPSTNRHSVIRYSSQSSVDRDSADVRFITFVFIKNFLKNCLL